MSARAGLTLTGAVILLLLAASASTLPASAAFGQQPRNTSALPHASLLPPSAATSGSTSYDEQMGITFAQDFASLAYNVTAVEQSDPQSNAGPAYILNGLSDSGYWYQVGLSWNWAPSHSPGDGFDFIFEVFDTSGNSVFPVSGGGGLLTFNGIVRQGDIVTLYLYFSGEQVVMRAEDPATGANAGVSYVAKGGTHFVGLTSSSSNYNGFFTGLMTEWYHSAPFYDNVSPVVYTTSRPGLLSAWMWIDEFGCTSIACTGRTILFNDHTATPIGLTPPTQLHSFSSNGATIYASSYRLITGPAFWDLTVSYAASGGSGYGQPLFRYNHNGARQSANLTTDPATYQVDVDGSWGVNQVLAGSNQTERWYLENQSPSGRAASNQTIVFLFQLQFHLTVSGGGGGADGDGWYDSGTIAKASSPGVFGRSSGEGSRIVSYVIDGQTTQVVPTSGIVEVIVSMSSAHALAFGSIIQFEVLVLGGSQGGLYSITSPAIPGDGNWFDTGSKVVAVLNGQWVEARGQDFGLSRIP